ITGASSKRKSKAEEGLRQLLGRDTDAAEAQLEEADTKLKQLKKKNKHLMADSETEDVIDVHEISEEVEKETKSAKGTKKATGTKKAAGTKKKAAKAASKAT